MSAGTPWGRFSYDAPEVWRYNNYPGQWVSTQLMAYYNDAGGLYVACDDRHRNAKIYCSLNGG